MCDYGVDLMHPLFKEHPKQLCTKKMIGKYANKLDVLFK